LAEGSTVATGPHVTLAKGPDPNLVRGPNKKLLLYVALAVAVAGDLFFPTRFFCPFFPHFMTFPDNIWHICEVVFFSLLLFVSFP